MIRRGQYMMAVNNASLVRSEEMHDAAGVGLIGMEAARHLAGRWLGFGPDRPTANATPSAWGWGAFFSSCLNAATG